MKPSQHLDSFDLMMGSTDILGKPYFFPEVGRNSPVFVCVFTFTWLGCALWSRDRVLALIPDAAYSSGGGANVCVSCLYSQACLHTLIHLGLFWRPVRSQASGTNGVCEKRAPCMFNYNRTLSFCLCLLLSVGLSSERRRLRAALHYCRLFEVWQEKRY